MELPTDRGISHEDLLTLARKSQAAAHDRDPRRVEEAGLHLFEAFLAHVGAERSALLGLSPSEARKVQRGQQRVVERLVELAISAELGGECRCETVAEELVARLTLQADDERQRLGR